MPRLLPVVCLWLAVHAICLAAGPAKAKPAPRATTPRTAAAAPPPAARTTPTPQDRIPFGAAERGLPFHAGAYGAFDIRWQTHSQIHAARGVWPHPYVASRLYVADGPTLMVSDDWGRTFQALPGALNAATLRSLEFVPDSPDSIYALAEGAGLRRTDDRGRTWAQVASKATGLVGDSPSQLVLYGGDPSFSTLLLGYGEAARGLSVSYDRGKSWSTLYPDLFVHDVISGGPGADWLYLVGSRKDEPDVRCVFWLRGLANRLDELARDVPVTADAVSALAGVTGSRPIYLLTEGRGLLWLMHQYDPSRWSSRPTIVPVGGAPEAEHFLSLGWTYGVNADVETVYLYEPAKLGLTLASRDKARMPRPSAEELKQPLPAETLAFKSFNDGLYTGPFVKEGSVLRASANGAVFYAGINGSLYVGRRLETGLDVSDVTVDPPVCLCDRPAAVAAFAKLAPAVADFDHGASAGARAKSLLDLFAAYRAVAPLDAVTITARIAGEDKPALVAADLSRLHPAWEGASRMPMADDGLHGDGTATDGVYGVTALLRQDAPGPDGGDWRRVVPGPVGVTVNAAGGEGEARILSGAVGVMSFFFKPEGRTLLDVNAAREWKDGTGLESQPLPDDSLPHPAQLFDVSLQVAVKDKPWELPWVNGLPNPGMNILGRQTLSFWIRSDRNTGKDVVIRLRDSVPDSLPHDGMKLGLLKDGLVEGGVIDATWRRVILPVPRALNGATQVVPTMVSGVVFSGDGGAAQTFWISDLVLYATADDLQRALTARKVTP